MSRQTQGRLSRKDAVKAGIAVLVLLVLLLSGVLALHFWEEKRYATG